MKEQTNHFEEFLAIMLYMAVFAFIPLGIFSYMAGSVLFENSDYWWIGMILSFIGFDFLFSIFGYLYLKSEEKRRKEDPVKYRIEKQQEERISNEIHEWVGAAFTALILNDIFNSKK